MDDAGGTRCGIADARYHRSMAINLSAGADAPRFEISDGQAALFHALAEPTRLALLQHLSTGEHRVRDLVDHMHLAQSTVSKHLACLRDCHLVRVRVQGRSSWFALEDPAGLSDLLARADGLLAATGTSLTLAGHDHDAHAVGERG